MNINRNKAILILGSFFAAIAIVLGVLFFNQNKELTEIVDTLNVEKSILLTEYESLVLGYDSIETDNDSIFFRLEIEQQKVVQLIEELETVKATNASRIRQYKKELNTLRTVMRHYVIHIDSLNRVNLALTEENQEVRAKFRKVTNALSEMEMEKVNLTEKVAIAAQMEANDIVVTPITDRGRKARNLSKTDRIKIEFVLSKNVTAPVGEKPIYARITAPNGDLLIKSDAKTFHFEDKDLSYSIIRVIEYGGESQAITVYWKVEEFLFEGNYKVDIFADNKHIGEQVFTLD